MNKSQLNQIVKILIDHNEPKLASIMGESKSPKALMKEGLQPTPKKQKRMNKEEFAHKWAGKWSMYIKEKKFLHPKTKEMVEYAQLPRREQSRVSKSFLRMTSSFNMEVDSSSFNPLRNPAFKFWENNKENLY